MYRVILFILVKFFQIIDLLENSNEYSKRQDEGFWNHFTKETPSITSTGKVGELEGKNETAEPSVEEKTRLQKLSEKGHALIDKTKEGIGHLTSEIIKSF